MAWNETLHADADALADAVAAALGEALDTALAARGHAALPWPAAAPRRR